MTQLEAFINRIRDVNSKLNYFYGNFIVINWIYELAQNRYLNLKFIKHDIMKPGGAFND